MNASLPLFLALFSLASQAQHTVRTPVQSRGALNGLPTNISPEPSNPQGARLPPNVTAVQPYTPEHSDGAIQTLGTLRQSQDSVMNRQSGLNRNLNPQEERFRRNLQGQQPQAIPSQGIGIPDPMNPNPNVAPTTPTPLP